MGRRLHSRVAVLPRSSVASPTVTHPAWQCLRLNDCSLVALATAQSVAVVPPRLRRLRLPDGDGMAVAFEHIALTEFMMTSERADKIEPNFGKMFKSEPLPDRGYIELPATPGFGLELDRNEVNLIRPYDRSGVQ